MSISHTHSHIFAGVVRRVKCSLRLRHSVYLCDFAGAYKLRITGIRYLRKTQSLQVQASYGWSTIWDTERLIDQNGVCLFAIRSRSK